MRGRGRIARVSVLCKSETLHGVITSKTGGEGTTLFKECTSSGLSCRGGKDASGEAPAGSIFELGASSSARTSGALKICS